MSVAYMVTGCDSLRI